MTSTTNPSSEVLLADFGHDIGLYKFYINFLLKTNAFQYAMTAAILSSVLSNKDEAVFLILLVFPLMLSSTLIFVCIKGSPKVKVLQDYMDRKAGQLGLQTYPDFTTLKILIASTVITNLFLIASFIFVIVRALEICPA